MKNFDGWGWKNGPAKDNKLSVVYFEQLLGAACTWKQPKVGKKPQQTSKNYDSHDQKTSSACTKIYCLQPMTMSENFNNIYRQSPIFSTITKSLLRGTAVWYFSAVSKWLEFGDGFFRKQNCFNRTGPVYCILKPKLK